MFKTFSELNQVLVECRRCPRLVAYRESVPAKKGYAEKDYWKRPVPGFGDPNAWLMIVGLAPSAHGGNRTGRIFTGDKSSDFLFKALHEVGFANKPFSIARDDGLKLHGCYLTAMVKCAPPKDKPTLQEFCNCHSYYKNELLLLKKVTHILALGKLAFDNVRKSLSWKKGYPFIHGSDYREGEGPHVFASYHPSPQNTNTGKLSKAMFIELLEKIRNSEKMF